MTGYLFVDGGYLRQRVAEISKHHFDAKDVRLDYNRLKSDIGAVKAFYYDCLPAAKSREDGEAWEKRKAAPAALFDEIRRTPGFHVFLGEMAGEGDRARQKGVDIQIAVHMMTHSFRKNMKYATLIAGDRDFKPLVEALVQDGLYVTICYSPLSVSPDLVDAADEGRPFSADTVLAWMALELQQELRYPLIYGITSSELKACSLIKAGRTHAGEDAKLVSASGTNVAAVVQHKYQHLFTLYEHRDEERLMLLLKDKGIKIEW